MLNRSTLSQQVWAEFVGTAILITLGNGVVANTIYAPRLGSGGYSWDTITLGWGFAVAMAIYVAGGITGAHLNPAITLAAITRKTLALPTGLAYMGAQLAGAFVGACLVWLIYQGSFLTRGFQNVFYTSPAPGYENLLPGQYFTEFVATFMLVLFVYAIVDHARNIGPGANLWPLLVGIAVLAIGLSLGGPTGFAINPARDLGPRVFAALIAGDTGAFSSTYFLVPIVGPLTGGVAGAWFYDFLVKPFLAAKDQPQPLAPSERRRAA